MRFAVIIRKSIFVVFLLQIITTAFSQMDTIYFIPVHEGVREGTFLTGLSYMGPSFRVNPANEDAYFNETSFDIKFGRFVEDKICIGVSMLTSDYYDKNNIRDNMYLYGLFTRLYQKDGSINSFLEFEANFGRKKYVINGLDEPVDKKVNAMFGFGIAWIDNKIMIELSVNANYWDHYNRDINNPNIETRQSGIYIQPRLGCNLYF